MPLSPRLTIEQTDKIVVAGTSITAAPVPWFRDLIAMSGAGIDIGRSPGRGGYYRHTDPAPPIDNWIASGVGGNTAGDIAAAVPARITAYAAQCLIIECAVNDVFFGVPDLTFAANFNSIPDQARAAQPNLKIACSSIFSFYEDTPNGFETDVANKNAIMAATMARVGGTFFDVHTPFLAWQAANNPSHDISGHLTVDGIHLTPLGVLMWSTWARPYINYPGR